MNSEQENISENTSGPSYFQLETPDSVEAAKMLKENEGFNTAQAERVTYVAFALFGVSSYAVVTGLWAEVSALVNTSPEGFNLSAYLIVFLQTSNLVPFAYMAMLQRRESNGRDKYLEPLIWVLLWCGASVALLLAFFHEHTSYVLGAERSTALLVLTFAAGAVSNSTNVFYWPFVSKFQKKFTTALSGGAGLSGLIFGVVSIAQDSGNNSGNPRFSVRVFFIFVAAVFITALVSFAHLSRISRAKPGEAGFSLLQGDDDEEDEGYAQLSDTSEVTECEDPCINGGGEGRRGTASTGPAEEPVGRPMLHHAGSFHGSPPGSISSTGRSSDPSQVLLTSPPTPVHANANEVRTNKRIWARRWRRWRRAMPLPRVGVLLGLQFSLAAMGYGFVPSIATVMCSGYRDSAHVLMFATTLSLFADPCSRFLTSVLRVYQFYLLSALAAAFGAVLVCCAVLTPNPPLHQVKTGGAVPIICYCGFTFVFAFTNTMIFLGIRKQVQVSEMESAYRMSGFITQLGAFTGTLIGFILVVTGLISA